MCTALLASDTFASEAKDMAAGIKCLPAKKIIKTMRKFDKMKPEKRDTINFIPKMQLIANENGSLPERVYFREGSVEHKFTMDEDGVVTDFARIGSMNKKGELCMRSEQFVGKADGEANMSLSMSFDVRFKNTSGNHTVAELIDGTKDGKSHYKKLFPAPLSLLIPKMTHVGINFHNDSDTGMPKIYAAKSGNEISGLLVEKFGSMFVVGIEDLQSLGADSLKIEGGKYELTPIPSIKKMKKLGFVEGAEDKDDAADEDDAADTEG